MGRMPSIGLVAGLLLAGGAAAAALSAQDATPQPGQPTQARVWIQNRGDAEAVPVSILDTAQPLRVELTTVPTVTIAPETVVQTRAARQPWEYRELRVAPGQSAVAALNAAGVDGWEIAGVTLTDQTGTALLMKRPR